MIQKSTKPALTWLIPLIKHSSLTNKIRRWYDQCKLYYNNNLYSILIAFYILPIGQFRIWIVINSSMVLPWKINFIPVNLLKLLCARISHLLTWLKGGGGCVNNIFSCEKFKKNEFKYIKNWKIPYFTMVMHYTLYMYLQYHLKFYDFYGCNSLC